MLGIPLILFGSVVVSLTIVTVVLFRIAGDFEGPVNVKVLIALGATGVVMLGLGIASLFYGIFLLRYAFTILMPILFLGLVFLSMRIFKGAKVSEYLRREYVKPVLRFLVGTGIRTGIITGVILLVDVIGLWVFLYSRGQWSHVSFVGPLTLLLLLEGPLISTGGTFVFLGYGEYRLRGPVTLRPTLANNRIGRWRERRLLQPKWGVAILIAGVILIFLGFLMGFLPPV